MKEEAKNFLRLEGDPSGDCALSRGGATVYLRNTHPHKAILATLRVVFDGGTPYFESVTVAPSSRERVGCSHWIPEVGHAQEYVRTIDQAKFV